MLHNFQQQHQLNIIIYLLHVSLCSQYLFTTCLISYSYSFSKLHVQQNKQVNHMEDPISQFKTWYFTQPPFTRYYLTLSFVIACALSMKIISGGMIVYTFQSTVYQLDLWRPFTSSACLGSFSFGYIFTVYLTHFILKQTQTQIFSKDNYADFLWLCIYLFFGFLIFASIFNLFIIAAGFVFSLMYIWAKRMPFETITLFFGFQVKSGYLPWVYMGFHILTGDNPYPYLIGLFLGHLYISIKDIYLPRYRRDFLPTPSFFKNLVNKVQRRAHVARQGVFQGGGVRLQ